MRALVLSGTGFIGRHATGRLVEGLHEVTVFARGDPGGATDDGSPAIVPGETHAQWRFTHGYVEDIADAIALAATDDAAAGRTYNLGPTKTPTQAEMVTRLAAVAAWHGRVVTVPDDARPHPQRTRLRPPGGSANPPL